MVNILYEYAKNKKLWNKFLKEFEEFMKSEIMGKLPFSKKKLKTLYETESNKVMISLQKGLKCNNMEK